jgi:hypothetical protein
MRSTRMRRQIESINRSVKRQKTAQFLANRAAFVFVALYPHTETPAAILQVDEVGQVFAVVGSRRELNRDQLRDNGWRVRCESWGVRLTARKLNGGSLKRKILFPFTSARRNIRRGFWPADISAMPQSKSQ